ncbi:MAG: LLM class flavin-dependent oxidoreductase [Acidimicrobiia bacterium]
MVSISVRFDLRVPPFANTTYAAQHQTALDIAEWADRLGFDSIGVSEHHGDPAGFTSAPITLAAALLGRTRRIPVGIGAALVPLHDPVRLAEQLATLDSLFPGRLSVTVGAGYRRREFEMAGLDYRQRGKLVEEFVDVCRQAWTGEEFEWRGRKVLVTPTPSTPNGPKMAMGGKTVLAARRAARLDMAFSPATGSAEVADAYFEACREYGVIPRMEGLGGKPPRPGFVMVARDPEAVWARISRYAVYDAETYASWQDDNVRSDWAMSSAITPESLRATNRYLVLSPAECIERARVDGGITLHPLMGGIEPELAWQSLKLFEDDVLPSLGRA